MCIIYIINIFNIKYLYFSLLDSLSAICTIKLPLNIILSFVYVCWARSYYYIAQDGLELMIPLPPKRVPMTDPESPRFRHPSFPFPTLTSFTYFLLPILVSMTKDSNPPPPSMVGRNSTTDLYPQLSFICSMTVFFFSLFFGGKIASYFYSKVNIMSRTVEVKSNDVNLEMGTLLCHG